MNFPFWIRRIAYNPNLIKLAKFLHIKEFLKKIYSRFVLPNDKKVQFSLFGVTAQLYVKNSEELMCIENILLDGRQGEIKVLNRIFNILQSGDAAYDIGANIGTHTIFIAKKVGDKGHVVSFEPEINNYQRLEQNIFLNRLNNVIFIQVALGDMIGEEVIYSDGSASSLIKSTSLDTSCQKIKVVPGDYLVQSKNLPLPKVVKIDVEGYEYYVIEGLKNTLKQAICQMVCCEIHPKMLPADIKPEMVFELLKTYGFNRIETFPRGETFHAFCYKS